MALEFGPLKRKEIRQAAELATRAFDDYEYFTNWFPDKEERNRVQLAVITHEYKAGDRKRIDDGLAMDAAAGQPCHEYQKIGPGIWYASSLTVDPTVQGIGLGIQFIEYWENYVRERSGEQIVFFTNSQKNLNFYLRRGYEVFDEREIEYNGHKMGSWSLKKAL